jgi:hypothetical protein
MGLIHTSYFARSHQILRRKRAVLLILAVNRFGPNTESVVS